MRLPLGLQLFLVYSLAQTGPAAPPQPGGKPSPRRDAHGEPLPEGALARLGTVRFRGTFLRHALSPDGRVVAVAVAGELRILDATTAAELRVVPHSQRGPAFLVFSPDGKRLVTGLPGERDWSLDMSAVVPAANQGRAGLVVVSNQADEANDPFVTDRYLSHGSGSTAHVWELATGKKVASVKTVPEIKGTSLSGDGKTLATWTSHLRVLRLWDVVTGKTRGMLTLSNGELQDREDISGAALSHDGKQIAVCAGKELSVWDATTGKVTERLAAHEGLACRFSPDGKLLVGLGSALGVQTWESSGWKRRDYTAEEEWQQGGQVVLTAEGRLLRLTSTGAALRLCELRSEKRRQEVGHDTPIVGLAFTTAGRTLHSISTDGVVCRWDVSTATLLRSQQLRNPLRVAGFNVELTQAVVSPDGRHLLTNNPRVAVLWNLETAREVCAFPVSCVADGHAGVFSGDGGQVLVRGPRLEFKQGELCVYEMATGRRLSSRPLAPEAVRVATLSPDGKLIALGGEVGRELECVRLLDAATGQQRWFRNLGDIAPPAFTPDGRIVGAVNGQGEVVLLETATGKEVGRLRGEERHHLAGVVFAPDGRTAASVCWDERKQPFLLVWELASRGKRLRLPGGVWSVPPAFSPDGAVLASAGPVPTAIVLWDMTGRVSAKPAAAADLDKLWIQLADADAAVAFAAMSRLIAAPGEAVALLRKELRPAPGLRVGRAVEVLERVATPPARDLLATFAQGNSREPLTREASVALHRLKAK